ncbi:hypothetical protein MGYG_03761 [Nannizzia gypsea CBS 118893]|uniref:DNA/RNA-binding domain-containing protein n=1 Tax=Arthroderma gypseum (strain ATCC MYA-4604 / CBS 118893) TaxID=535722 RepID=E4UTV1_ARTGP|nr:hypothetical protein MGYG_03761 [Nannizzia gypsea CBS 118893]EFR00757.1 hypothetical protein MGYG_03761 [Nannizzia gypsea CBS 118893]
MVRVDLDHRQRQQHLQQQPPADAQSLQRTSWSSFDKVEQSPSPSPSSSPSPSPSRSPSLSPSPSPLASVSASGSISASRTSGQADEKEDAEEKISVTGRTRSPDASALQNLNIHELTPKARSRRQSKSNLASPRQLQYHLQHQQQGQCNTTPKKRAASERDDDDDDADGSSSKRCSHYTVKRCGVFFQARAADDGFIDQAIDDDLDDDDDDNDDDLDDVEEQAGAKVKEEDDEGYGHDRSLPHSLPCSPDLFLQPETRQISEEQLIVEVQGIYSGLVVIEKKCVEIDMQQLNGRSELSNEQWKALIAIHRTLLHEHHDFFLASQHPSATPRLRRLATEYGMPARMWRHGVHSFLELLRHRLPGSLEHMISFIYIAYSMMTLLLESVPAFSRIWIECLGDLARYQMAVEEVDLYNREKWAEVARYWYRMAADKGPNVGRIQHHAAVLARPNILAQLFYYTKSLVCVEPFASSRESILLLFNPLLEEDRRQQKQQQQKQQEQQQQNKLHKHSRPRQQPRHPLALASFVKAHGILFKKESVHSYFEHTLQFFSCLPQHVGRMGEKFREQGVQISCSNFATLFINDNSLAPAVANTLTDLYKLAVAKPADCRIPSARAYWSTCSARSEPIVSLLDSIPQSSNTRFSSSLSPLYYTIYQSMHTFSLLLRQIGDKNVLPAIHVSLAFLFTLSLTPEAMHVFEPLVPFRDLVTFLNTLNRHRVSESKITSDEFPLTESSDVGVKYHLPEEFDLRGLAWARLYFPDGHFVNTELAEEEDRTLELAHTANVRAERCLWLGHRMASMDRWFTYDPAQKRFKIKDLVLQLEQCSERVSFFRKAAEILAEST